MKNLILISFLWLSVTSLVQAESTELMFSPAHFGTGSDSFHAKLECPAQQGKKEIAGVFCRAVVTENGDIVDDDTLSFCFGPTPEDMKYVKVTEAALAKSKFQPAMVGGASKKVTVLFRVLFGYQSGSCQYAALPNWGYQQKKFGPKYFSPQKIFSENNTGWSNKSDYLQKRDKSTLSDDRIMSRVSVMVTDSGEPGDVKKEEQKSRSYEKETQAAMQRLREAHFIPGFYKDKPQAMRYNEMLFVDPVTRGKTKNINPPPFITTG